MTWNNEIQLKQFRKSCRLWLPYADILLPTSCKQQEKHCCSSQFVLSDLRRCSRKQKAAAWFFIITIFLTATNIYSGLCFCSGRRDLELFLSLIKDYLDTAFRNSKVNTDNTPSWNSCFKDLPSYPGTSKN